MVVERRSAVFGRLLMRPAEPVLLRLGDKGNDIVGVRPVALVLRLGDRGKGNEGMSDRRGGEDILLFGFAL